MLPDPWPRLVPFDGARIGIEYKNEIDIAQGDHDVAGLEHRVGGCIGLLQDLDIVEVRDSVALVANAVVAHRQYECFEAGLVEDAGQGNFP